MTDLLKPIQLQGGLKHNEVHIVGAVTPISKSKRVATLPKEIDADCLYCKSTLRMTVEGSAGKETNCPICSAHHVFEEVDDNGEVTVRASLV
ncbi:hypothetical protein [Ewingella americana]|uniref:Uncharacterized protein n=1 Tax=Ewingella americana TaxID=41202 RepID=A0A502GG49_9GAMM|nr:hypothetical protein [Ewingella americana]TPG59976.1 hypothetical protein EAH77_15530 [Ewingella americana]